MFRNPPKSQLLFVFALIGVAIGFIFIHYQILFLNYYRPHGDFTLMHFSQNIYLEGIFQDGEIPLWQPYRFFGTPDIWLLFTHNIVHTLLSSFVWGLFSFFESTSHLGFQITFIGFLLEYILIFGIGCLLLAKELTQSRIVLVLAFSVSLIGSHLHFMVYMGTYTLLYMPWVVFFWIRILKKARLLPNLSGLILAVASLLSSGPAL